MEGYGEVVGATGERRKRRAEGKIDKQNDGPTDICDAMTVKTNTTI